jgi:hypothetical protein
MRSWHSGIVHFVPFVPEHKRPHLAFVSSPERSTLLECTYSLDLTEGSTEKAKGNIEFHPSFLFLQWTAPPTPISLVITQWLFESSWIDSILSSLGSPQRGPSWILLGHGRLINSAMCSCDSSSTGATGKDDGVVQRKKTKTR